MEKHPIPRDVTGFQFKLIGDMTVKQFTYLAGGSILAYVFFSLNIPAVIKFPLAFIFAVSGFSLAFLPIAGRPLDTMLRYFIKALISPNQYVYQKSTGQQDKPVLRSVPGLNLTSSAPQPNPKSEPSLQPDQAEEVLEKEELILEKEIESAKKQEANSHETKQTGEAHQRVAELEKQLSDVFAQKKQLEDQLAALSEKLKTNPQNIYAPNPALSKTQVHASNTVVQPEFANVIKGIIKDARDNVLPGILVEVRDKDGNPVRAFKTNDLGKFASATALANGDYTVHFEDPNEKQDFTTVEITAKGELIPLLEITSTDAREKLRKELFGSPS